MKGQLALMQAETTAHLETITRHRSSAALAKAIECLQAAYTADALASGTAEAAQGMAAISALGFELQKATADAAEQAANAKRAESLLAHTQRRLKDLETALASRAVCTYPKQIYVGGHAGPRRSSAGTA